MTEPAVGRIGLQNAEFFALAKLVKKFEVLMNVPVVDDDYPEYRHYYESALRMFLEACSANGRRVGPSSSESDLWQALGRWTAEIARIGPHAELAPPKYVLDAVTGLANSRGPL